MWLTTNRDFWHTDRKSARVLRLGHRDRDQNKLIGLCSRDQHAVVSDYIHVFDHSATAGGKHGIPRDHGWCWERGLHHLDESTEA